jgi:hypothetical protein
MSGDGGELPSRRRLRETQVSGLRGHLVAIVEIAKARARSSALTEHEALALTDILRHTRAAIAELPAPGPDVDEQLEAAARSDADEVLQPRSYGKRDTDPVMPVIADDEASER